MTVYRMTNCQEVVAGVRALWTIDLFGGSAASVTKDAPHIWPGWRDPV